MSKDFTPTQKRAIAGYVQWLLKQQSITQKQIAIEHGCSGPSVSIAVHQGPMHEAMPKLKNFIARNLAIPVFH